MVFAPPRWNSLGFHPGTILRIYRAGRRDEQNRSNLHPACPVTLADGTGVAPEDGTGVKCLPCEMQSLFHRGVAYSPGAKYISLGRRCTFCVITKRQKSEMSNPDSAIRNPQTEQSCGSKKVTYLPMDVPSRVPRLSKKSNSVGKCWPPRYETSRSSCSKSYST